MLKTNISNKKIRRKNAMYSKAKPYAMVAPAMIFLLAFTFFPTVYLVFLSFFDYNLISDMKFVGFNNYERLFTIETTFWEALKNTFAYTGGLIVLLIISSLLLAIWLEKSTVLNSIAQRLMFLPHLCATLTVSVIFQWLMDDKGLLNAMLNFLNMPGLRWLNSSTTAMLSVVIISFWKSLGYYTLIMLASLKAIPTEIGEAAALDNAHPVRKFFKITLPMVSPQLFFILITITMGSFQVFDTIRLLTEGGPGNSTNTIIYWIYMKAFGGTLQVGMAATAGVIAMVIMGLLTLIYFKTLNNKVHYQ